jgi:multidrug efflux pump subunit AcrB
MEAMYGTPGNMNPYYADGGRVGLFMGGSPLDGQALSIYNSMKAYDFTDQQIADALAAQGLYTPSGSSTPETTAPNIIGSQINQGGGGDGIQSIGPQNIASFTETVEARQNRLNNPGKIADFINSNLGKIGINTQRSANEMLASGIKDTRATSGIPFGISGMIARALPNAYTDKLTLGEQVFSQENMGFTGQGNMANKDPFGINVVSAFGNYADYVKDRVAELEDIVADQKKRGLTDTYQMKELAFRSKQNIDRQNRISDAAKIQELQRKEKERIAKANTARQVVMEEARQRGDNPSAGTFSSNSPGGISQQTSRDARGGMSGWGLRDGGLATMFKEKR